MGFPVLTGVKRGYKGFLVDTRNYRGLRVSPGFLGVTRGYRGYKGLQGVTICDKRLYGVTKRLLGPPRGTGAYKGSPGTLKGLHRAKRSYKGLQGFPKG